MHPTGYSSSQSARSHLNLTVPYGIFEARLHPKHAYIAENLEQYAELLSKMGDEAGAAEMQARAERIRAAGT